MSLFEQKIDSHSSVSNPADRKELLRSCINEKDLSGQKEAGTRKPF